MSKEQNKKSEADAASAVNALVMPTPDKDISADFFYHAVSNEVLEIYHEQGYMWNDYYDGIWITPDIWHAVDFGRNLFRLDALYLDEEMDWNNNDDGILYKGKVQFHNVKLINDDIYDRDYKKLMKHRQYMRDFLTQPIEID